MTALGAAAVAAALFGCAASGHTGASHQDLSPFPFQPTAANPVVLKVAGAVMLADGTPVLPLDAYDGYAQATVENTLIRAAAEIEHTCMASRGLAIPAGYADQFFPGTMPGVSYYGVTSTSEARTFGYRLPQSAPTAPTPTAPASVPANVLSAFYGTGDGTDGCAHSAYDKLGIATANNDFDHLNDLRSQALEQAAKDPRLTRATTAWSRCMLAAGYAYPSPLAPGQDKTLLGRGLPVPRGAALAPVSTAERAAAETDVACKQKTDYLQSYLAVVADHQQQLITANHAHLQQDLRDWHQALDDADTALR